ncbi:MAG TPA: ABC transporter substrate-binding protein [Stellaceae bacterium]|nr:ABC transporter substrate-binding protein [Stellaceae bacterium]
MAADKLVVGKAAPGAFSFVPLDIGMEKGFFAKRGLEIQSLGFSGSAKLHQAMAAGNLDIGLGAGSDVIFPIKGDPETGVANLAGPPLLMSFIVPWNSPVKTADDLKGKRVGISTVNSLTQWLALELARQKGWGPDGLTFITVGAETAPQVAALVTGQIDALVSSTALGLRLAQEQRGRDLFPASDVVKVFMIHAIYASNQLLHDKPDAVRRFLAGWFETIAYMRKNKEETVRITRTVTNFPQDVEDQEYDIVMPMFSLDGKFDPAALAVLRRSFVDLHLLDTEPDLTKYFTEAYLPNLLKS